MWRSNLFSVTKEAAKSWIADDAPTLGAALAYYAIFSLAPLILIVMGVASMIIEEDVARTQFREEIHETLGPLIADALIAMLNDASNKAAGKGLTLVGLGTLLLGASGVFVQLQSALNVVWKTTALPRQGSALMHFVRNRLLSFVAVLAMGLILLMALIVSSVLSALSHSAVLPSMPITAQLWHAISFLASFCLVTLLFGVIFKLLPDTEVCWQDVWLGAVATGVLFTVGQQLIGLYLGTASVAWTYGAAGSLVVLLVWVYYTAQIVLFGAEFTYAYARICGSHCLRKGPAAKAKTSGSVQLFRS